MLAEHIKVDAIMDIGSALREIVYNIIETTCTAIFFIVIIIHLCYYLHSSYCGDNESDPEARNGEDISNPLVVASTPLASSVSDHASGSEGTSPGSRAVSRLSDDKECTPRVQVLSNAACPVSGTFSSLVVGAEPLLVAVNGPHVVKPAGSAVPLRLSTFTPFLVSFVDPPSEGSEFSTDRPQALVTADAPPPTDAAPTRPLKTASVDFILFLAWKVVSQKRAVPRPRRRLCLARGLPQRIVRQHLRYNAKIAVSGATLQSRRSLCASPALDVLPVLPHMSSARLDVSTSSVELPVSTPVLPSGCGLTCYQDLRSRPRALIHGKQLYGARKIKSARPQPDRASRSRLFSSPSRTFSSSASAEFIPLDICFSKLGEATAVQRREAFPRRLLAAANARFSAPVA
ncbi:hypothetical protein FOMPIDRAFT_88134 [Fomitopsis schrenkii]|uniref:Uncharacterized protein n=1 Tax=Fomitopsis schrenkii TaxID=2126942 RepID=S8EXD9_FOMSC|nr:hypothetical protein FOMPIDRAFT_88134 [Fomitopsis schrenkii]